jgi:hypothetical protein
MMWTEPTLSLLFGTNVLLCSARGVLRRAALLPSLFDTTGFVNRL